jgi:hypothetical protein
MGLIKFQYSIQTIPLNETALLVSLRPPLTERRVRQSAYLFAFVGRAIAQAVSRWLPTTAARVQTRVWSCGIL